MAFSKPVIVLASEPFKSGSTSALTLVLSRKFCVRRKTVGLK
ncbi:hypothetical protein [Fluviicola sp.]